MISLTHISYQTMRVLQGIAGRAFLAEAAEALAVTGVADAVRRRAMP